MSGPYRIMECTHGIVFDVDGAKAVFDKMTAEGKSAIQITIEIRRNWPRLDGDCPKGCGFRGIFYTSTAHYHWGDW